MELPYFLTSILLFFSIKEIFELCIHSGDKSYKYDCEIVWNCQLVCSIFGLLKPHEPAGEHVKSKITPPALFVALPQF